MPDPFVPPVLPNPTGRKRPLQSFEGRAHVELIGKDTFFGTFGQGVANLDWPMPKGRPFPILLRTWVGNLLQSTLAPVLASPFAQIDWPNPRVRVPSGELRAFAARHFTPLAPPVIVRMRRAEKVTPGSAHRVEKR